MKMKETAPWLVVALLAVLVCPKAVSGAEKPTDNRELRTVLVGELGRKQALVIEGNKTFTMEQILDGMKWHMDYHVAAHPAAPLSGYIALLERKITLGYQRSGFPNVLVKAAADTGGRRIVVTVNEGPRFRCGNILVSGVRTTTNAIVRQKIVDVLVGFEPGAGQKTNVNQIAWTRNEPAPFDEASRRGLKELVEEALAGLDYYQPEVSVRLAPDPVRKLADLKVEIADEGVKGTIDEIEVTGIRFNTRQQVLDYLKLKPGMELHADSLNTISNQLWKSARFLHQGVILRPLPQGAKFKLEIDVEDLSAAPLLNQEFSPKEKALLKFRDWLAGWEGRPEDFVCSADITNSWARIHADAVVSPSGFALIAREQSSNSPSLGYAVVASTERLGFYSAWRESKFVFKGTAEKVGLLIQISPPNPIAGLIGHLAFGLGFGDEALSPFRLKLDLPPLAFLGAAYCMDSSLKEGVLTIHTNYPTDNAWQDVRVDAATGRLIQFANAWGEPDSRCVLRLHVEEGAFARAVKEIAAATADHPNEYMSNRAFSSWLSFLATDLIKSPLTEPMLQSWSEEEGAKVQGANAIARLKLKPLLAQAAEIFSKQNLASIFEPLDRLGSSKPEESEEETFFVPREDEFSNQNANPMVAAVGAGAVAYSDVLLNRDSWPWILVRETAFTLAGQGKYSRAELDKLLKSDDVGPLGCLATAFLLAKVDPKLARTFAERGRSRLSTTEFHKDYRVLLQTNSVFSEMAAKALGLLQGVNEAQAAVLTADLSAEQGALFRQLARSIREAKDQPPGEAAWPVVEQYWNKSVRRYLELGLNVFLPQVQFLTDSKALYERGLALISPNSMMQDFDEAAQCFRKAAEQGHAGAQIQLGTLLEAGQGVPQDFAAAMRWYRQAFEQKEPHASCRLADLYFEGKGVTRDLNEAAKWYRIEAEGTCSASQFNLGRICEEQHHTPEALKWYRRAAEGGLTAAQVKLGELLSDGFFTAPDLVEACQWLSLAADAGDKACEIRLQRVRTKLTNEQWNDVRKRAEAITQRIQDGGKADKNVSTVAGQKKSEEIGSPPPAAQESKQRSEAQDHGEDGAQARKAFEEVRAKAEKGDAEAQYQTGDAYRQGKGVPQDAAEAVKWYRKAAEQNNAAAQSYLGVGYLNGIGVEKDETEAVKWFRKAAEQNFAGAQCALGFCYLHGQGVEKDSTQAVEWFRRAAEQNYAHAEHNLGVCYATGQGVEKDYKKAVEWHRKAAEQNDAESQCSLGTSYFNGQGVEKESTQAVKWYRKAAEQNHAEAEHKLGVCYATGQGVEKNSTQAVEWFRKAAEQNHAVAQYNLGVCYGEGLGVATNYVEAVKWFRKAAEQNCVEAQNNLGFCYANGQGVATNHVEAVKWFRKVAEQNDAAGQDNLGDCYATGQGVEKDYKEAVKWYRKAAEQNNAEAQHSLGGCYYKGQGVEKDYAEAVKWYRKAAEQHHAAAQRDLGRSYSRGQGVEKDHKEAFEWYRQAADQNDAEAQHYLGLCYWNGEGVEKDYKEAVKWYRKAAEQNFAEAQYSLGNSYRVGQGVEKSSKEAVEWYRKAAEQNHVGAQYNLGTCYYTGQGVEKDSKEAVKWYRKAAEQNDASAQGKLGVCYVMGQGVATNYVEAARWLRKAAEQGDARAQKALGILLQTVGPPPPRSPQASPLLIDLTAYYNAALNEAWHYGKGAKGVDLAELPTGVQTLAGVQFDVRGIIQLSSKRSQPWFPEKVEGIRIEQKCRTLHFLHATGWAAKDGTKIGNFIIHYADGQTKEVPVVYGEDLREWHGRSDAVQTIVQGKLAWSWPGDSLKRRLFMSSHQNSLPEVEITTLDYVSAMTDCFPFLIAITVE